MSEMSFEDAVAALDAAVAQDEGETPELPGVPETPAAPEQAPPAPTTPEGETPAPQDPARKRDEFGRFVSDEPETEAPETFDSGKFNPDELPDELKPGWKQLQAEWTRKTQALAEERRQYEGIDPEEARQALALYGALKDPDYLVQFYGELKTALEAQGLTPREAEAEAARQIEEASTDPHEDPLAKLGEDEELAPIAREFKTLREELKALKAERESERLERDEQEAQLKLASEMLEQEQYLRENKFSQADINRCHELSPWYDGDLVEAAKALVSIKNEAIEEYLAQKGAVPTGATPVPGREMTSEVPTEIGDLNEAMQAALGHLAANDLTDLE
jgi:hypothetical protein